MEFVLDWLALLGFHRMRIEAHNDDNMIINYCFFAAILKSHLPLFIFYTHLIQFRAAAG